MILIRRISVPNSFETQILGSYPVLGPKKYMNFMKPLEKNRRYQHCTATGGAMGHRK